MQHWVYGLKYNGLQCKSVPKAAGVYPRLIPEGLEVLRRMMMNSRHKFTG